MVPSSKSILWQTETGQTVAQPPLPIGETVLLATQSSGREGQHGRLQALSLADGAKKWQQEFEYATISGLLKVHLPGQEEPFILVATSSTDFLKGEGQLAAFDEAGNRLWQWQEKAQHYSQPILHDGKAIFTAGGKSLVLLDLTTETHGVQQINLNSNASLAAPAVSDNFIYVPARSPDLLAVDINTAAQAQFRVEGSSREWLAETPLVTAEKVYAASTLGTLFCLEPETLQLIWKAEVGNGRALSSPVWRDNVLYLGARQGLLAVDGNNGRLLWTFRTSRAVVAPPLLYNDLIYVTCQDHFLYALDFEGKIVWQHEMSRRIEQPPVLAPNALLVADRGGKVAALERPPEPEPEPEPEPDPETLRRRRRELLRRFTESGKHLEAAEMWHEIGELEQAARQYEAGEAWEKAAGIWQQLDKYGKRAEAYRQRARVLSASEADDEEKAAAWEEAARAFAESGDKETRYRCEREVARYRREPILTLDIGPEPMEVNAWSELKYMVRNEGFGPARSLFVRLKEDMFKTEEVHTSSIFTLAPNQTYRHSILVQPRQHGTTVPIWLVVEYIDRQGRARVETHQFTLDVAGESEIPTDRPQLHPQDSDDLLIPLNQSGGVDLVQLRRKMLNAFDRTELLDIIFELGYRTDNFENKLVQEITKDLVLSINKNGRLPDLITICRTRRPGREW